MFYIQYGNRTGELSILIRKQVPDGTNTQNKFVVSITDILIGVDIPYGITNEYEYEDNITPAPTVAPDICVTAGADAAVNQRNTILIGVFGGLGVLLLIIIAILIIIGNQQTKKPATGKGPGGGGRAVVPGEV